MGIFFAPGWDNSDNHVSSVGQSGIERIFDNWDVNGHMDMRDKARAGRVTFFSNGDDVKVLKGIHPDGRGTAHITVEYWFDTYHIDVEKDGNGYYRAIAVSRSRWH